MANIEFGTDGFRGVIADDFTFENVRKITNGIAKYLLDNSFEICSDAGKSVIVGFDPRFMAADFARFSAEILKSYGFRVVLSQKICPTPIVAYEALNSLGAIMFTASHNPSKYLGMKFIPKYGGPATKEITDEIVGNLDWSEEERPNGKISEKDFSGNYFEHIEKLIDFAAIKTAQKSQEGGKLKIIYDGLYSASIGYFDKLLEKNGIEFEKYNCVFDPNFGGNLPEPKPGFLKHHKDGFITVANDGDADRYGVLNEHGEYVSPNVIMALLTQYLLKKGQRGKLIKTVGSSLMLDILAKKLNIETITTAVGFKWVGEAMRDDNSGETLLAGEDSGGLSIGGHIPEKDGILANLLILEMLAYEGKTLVQLQEELDNFIGKKFINDRVDLRLADSKKIAEIMQKIDSEETFAGFKIVSKNKIDGIKIFLGENLQEPAAWVLIRKSGTEPLLRFYIETDSQSMTEELKAFIKTIY